MGTLLSNSIWAQEYSYTHYDIADGLAGSTVYSIAQDSDGFLWISTETGVSRFDGTHFRNFTIADGLPDIEVLQLFGDREGRLWMAPFRKSVCFWYQGRMHTQDNDSLLGKIHLRQNVEYFAEDTDGNILIQETSALRLLLRDGRMKDYDSLGKTPVYSATAVCLDSSGHFQVQVAEQIFRVTDTGYSLLCKLPFGGYHPNFTAMSRSYLVGRTMSSEQFKIFSLSQGIAIRRPFDRDVNRHISFTLLADSLLYTNEIMGCTETNLRTGAMRSFLPGKPVSRVFRDVDDNLWFATLGQGIYRLNSDEFGLKRIPTRDADHCGVMSIARFNGDLWVGTDRNQLLQLSLPALDIIGEAAGRPLAKNRVLCLDTLDGGGMAVGSDNHLDEFLGGVALRPGRVGAIAIKSMAWRGDGRLLVASVWGVGYFDIRRWRFTDTLWRDRATTAFGHLDTIYIGTLNGLYRLNGRSSVDYLGARNPFLRTRISAIARDSDGIYWIASYGAGIIGYRNDSVVAVINKRSGLTSDICRALLLKGKTLWMGTDRGLNRIRLDKPDRPVTVFTSNDGLGSDIVNTIYSDGSVIYVGTAAGLSYFDPEKTGEKEGCRLYLLSVLNNGKDRTADSSNLVIPYSERSIRFEFAGISYRSGGDIQYRYRLMGLDSSWQTTRLTVLEYAVLPAGNYAFQLMAVNKFGIASRIFTLRFSVLTPFWRTGWFDVLLVVVFALGTWGLATWRIRMIRRRQRERDQLAKKMVEVERMALQAQMNPHFIFNCLTSVQQYIVDQDIFSANKYITGLARVIRLTLHNSSLAFIPLGDEVDYLSAYLALEKLRFKDKMDYTIDVAPDIVKSACYIPPMLIQPYVENSIRHGLRHKQTGKGYIRIRFLQDAAAEPHKLKVIVEDNGIGRETAAGYRTKEHISYQSKGMTMTAERMRMINIAYGGDFRVEVVDLKDEDGVPKGTRVIMQFTPFDHLHPDPNQKEML